MRRRARSPRSCSPSRSALRVQQRPAARSRASSRSGAPSPARSPSTARSASRTTRRAATPMRAPRSRPRRGSTRTTARRRSTSVSPPRSWATWPRRSARTRRISRSDGRAACAGSCSRASRRSRAGSSPKTRSARSSRSTRSARSPARRPPSPCCPCGSAAATARSARSSAASPSCSRPISSRSSKLTVVERARIQALLDELALQQQRADRRDDATCAPAGSLRAGRVVQGSILQVGGSQLRVDAAVLDVPTTAGARHGAGRGCSSTSCSTSRSASRSVCSTQLGVTLTVAERNAIEQRPTRSLAAFLAYSRGLTAEDDGRFDDASRFYRDAIRLDPGFGAALQRNRERDSSPERSSVGALARGGSRGRRSVGRRGGARPATRDGGDDLNPSSADAATAPGTQRRARPAAEGSRLRRHQHRQARQRNGRAR